MTTTVERQEPAGAAPRRRKRKGHTWLIALAIGALAMLSFSLPAYIPPEMSTSRVPPENTFHFVALLGHIFTGAVALLTGLAQLWPWLRRTHPTVHRWTGRAYFFLGIFPSIAFATVATYYAPFGFGNQSALAALVILWAITGVAGFRAVRQRRYADHRKWMLRNFALTFAGSVTTRLFMPVAYVFIALQPGTYGGDEALITHDAAAASAWLGLIVNVVIVEWYVERKYGGRTRRAQAKPV